MLYKTAMEFAKQLLPKIKLINEELEGFQIIAKLENQEEEMYFATQNLRELDKLPSRSELAKQTREFVKEFAVFFVILFEYQVEGKKYITLSVAQTHNRKNNSDGGGNIVEKVILLKDIDVVNPHRAHIEILGKLTTNETSMEKLKSHFLSVLSVSALCNQFYNVLQNSKGGLYKDLCDSLILQGNVSEEAKKDFGLRLIGRLIFCWFLREKNWISKEILGSKFIKENVGVDYYRQILEPLFFETLNKKEDLRDYGANLWAKELGISPYLNGGLFQAKDVDFYTQAVVSTEILHEILVHFESFVFTVDENTSLEEIVGVDPEMMGRVFENFILNRSSTGSFYTPREIVDYMVSGSLAESLKNKFVILPQNKEQVLGWTKMHTEHLQGEVTLRPNSKVILQNKLGRISISAYLIAKLQGQKYNYNTGQFINCNKHLEINLSVWDSFFEDKFELVSLFIPDCFELKIEGKNYWLPKIGYIIEIEIDSEKIKFALVCSAHLDGKIQIDTFYRLFDDKKIAKLCGKNSLDSLCVLRQNVGQELFEKLAEIYVGKENTSKLLDIIKTSRVDALLTILSTMPGPRFSALQEVYGLIITQKSSFVKSIFGKDVVLSYIQGVLENTAFNLQDQKKQKIANHLRSLKILDPACGSGAFPMGILQKMTEIIKILEPQKTLFEIKYEILKNCIFGSDILPIAVEISRLRAWLSLIVDEKTAQPLPNLEFKFVGANSLIGINEQASQLIDPELEKLENQLKNLRKQSFQPAQDKAKLRQKWQQITKQIFQIKLDGGFYVGNPTDLTAWDPFSNKVADFFDSNWMFEVQGFDIILGNPPYVGEKGNKDTFEPLKTSKLGQRFYQGKMDLFYFFFHHSLDCLVPNGILSFITTNYYITATGGSKLRQDIQNRANVLQLINFGELKVFPSATGQHNLITILQKKTVKNNYENLASKNFPSLEGVPQSGGVVLNSLGQKATSLDKLSTPQEENLQIPNPAKTIVTKNKGYLGEKVLHQIITEIDPNTDYYTIPQDQLFKNGNIVLTNGGKDEVLDKMLINSVNLGEICQVNQGIVSGGDKVNKQVLEIENLSIDNIGNGLFVLNDNEINCKQIESEIYKPFYKNSEIKRYGTSIFTDQNILFLSKEIKTEQYLLENFSNTHLHLSNFRTTMILRRQKLGEKIDQWFTLNRGTGHKEIFELPKIVVPQRSKTNTFGYNEVSWYASADVYFITQPKDDYNLKFLLGVLNSKLIYHWLYNRGKRKGEMLELYQEPLSRIPIPILDTVAKQDLAQQIEALVEEILEVKSKNSPSQKGCQLQVGGAVSHNLNLKTTSPNKLGTPENLANTNHLESQIDQLVYQLYDLSEAEIKVIEK